MSLSNKGVSILTLVAVFFSMVCQQALGQTGLLKITPTSINYSSEGEVTVVYENTLAASAFQFDIHLPAGFSYIGNSAVLQADRKADHQLSANVQNGKLILIGYSISGADLKGATGALVKFKVKAPAQPGSYAFNLTNVEFSDKAGAKVAVNTESGTISVLAPQLSTSNEINFWSVPLNEQRQNYLYINNTGNQNLVISDIKTDDSRFKVEATLPITIASSSWGTSVPVSFKSEVKGNIEQKLTITSNSSTEPVKVVALKATAFAVNEMSVGSVTSKNLEDAKVSVSIKNMEAFSAFEFKMPLTEEMEYVTGSAVLSTRQDGHTVSASVKDKVLTVVAFSLNNKAFKLNEGEVVSFKLKTTGQGSFPLTLQGAEIADLNGVNVISATYNGSLTIQSPYISFSSSALDFGKVSVIESGERSLTIYNTGQADLVVTGLDLISTYFRHNLTFPFTITPASNKQVIFTFSGAPAGTHKITAKLYHSDKNNNPSNIQLQAVSFEPNELSITNRSVSKGGTVQAEINLKNFSNVVGFQFDVTLPEGFSASASEFALTSRQNGHTISVREVSKNVFRVVAFSMSSAKFTGNEGAIVTFPVKAGTGVANGPHTLSLSNAEVSNDKLTDVLSSTTNGTFTVVVPKFSLSTSMLDFGAVSVVESKEQKLSISNTGQADLVLTGLDLNNASFTHNLTFPVTIAAGANKEVTFTFASSVAGDYQVTAKLHHNDAASTPSEITLRARAMAYSGIALSSSSLDFGDVQIGQSKVQTLIISNSGQGELVLSNLELGSVGFTHNLNFPVSIAAGANKELTITFAPTLAGDYQIAAKLHHNSAGNTSAILLNATAYAPYNNVLQVGNLTVEKGGNGQAELKLNNNNNIIGFQFDVTLPQGVTTNTGQFALTARADGHSITVSEVSANKFRVIVFSMNSAKFKGTNGAVVTFPVNVGTAVASGTYAITLSNAEASNDKLKQVLSGTTNGILTVISPSPVKSVLSSPTNNSTNISLKPQLTWQATADAASYNLQVSTKADFSTSLINLSNLSSTNYNIEQDLVNNTVYYWRVQAVNSTGTGAWSDTWSFTTQSTITSIKDDLDESFLVYPNPSAGVLMLTLPENFSAGKVQIKDLNGRLVYDKKVFRSDKNIVFEATSLASGVYLVVLIEDGKTVGIRRWIKT